MLKNFTNYWQNKNRLWKIVMIISIALFFLVLIAAVLYGVKFFSKKAEEVFSQKTELKQEEEFITYKDKCDGCVRRKLDGVYVKPEAANLPPAAVMIDNHPSARPSAGIEKASLVYEAEVEGSYTRFMAIFATKKEVKEIGPVRSARPYFIDWAQELNAVYVHCGGSPEALVDIIQKELTDLNEFYNGQYFWRANDRTAPHNILISSVSLDKFLENKKIIAGNYPSWQFKDDTPLNNASSSREIKIEYSSSEFRIKWVYDDVDNDYIRYQEDKPVLTAENNIIVAKNVIIQIVPAKVIDSVLRLKMDDLGSGEAIICLDGGCREGEWNKIDTSSRTNFTYNNGEEVEFNAGPTWIEVVRPEIAVEY